MNITEKRIDKMLSLIKNTVVADICPVDEVYFKECGCKIGTSMPSDEGFAVFEKDMRWGKDVDTHGWFRLKGVLPKKYSFCRLRLHADTSRDGWNVYNPQFIMYVDGNAVQGFDANHRYAEFAYRENYDVYLYAYTGSMGKNLDFKAYFELIDESAEKLWYDLSVLYETAMLSDENSKEYADLIRVICEAIDLIDFRDTASPSYRASVSAANAVIDGFFDTKCRVGDKKVVCVGHTHIDVAWLWTLAQTKEKAQHTFSTVLALMDKFPDLVFMSSQPQLLKFVKEEDPLLYARIKEKIKEGRFEVEGGMWVEADCNLTSGESLVRQFIHGKRFFREEYGVDSKILWLPDVFGYAPSLPQICKKSGVDTFVTSKISWNDTNRMPHDVFEWTGIDGTKIFTYFLTAQEKTRGKETANYTTYVATSDPSYVAGCFDRFSDKSYTDEVILTMGWGDGGGGPTDKMCQKAERLKKGVPGCPTVVYGKATDFINRLKENVKDRKLPSWEGELYLEYHRGTYTVAAKNKYFNRVSEFAAANAELWSAAASIEKGVSYPEKELYSAWETILLNQFHDIIPGSSIPEVYKVSRSQYASLLANLKDITSRAMSSLGGHVFNPTFSTSGLAYDNGKYTYFPVLPPLGWSKEKGVSSNGVKIGESELENRYYVIRFNEDGYISYLYDKENDFEVQTGVIGGLIAYEDLPFQYDCWNIEEYHEEKPYEVGGFVSIKPIQRGAGAGFEIKRVFMQSEITQEIIIFDESRRIDFRNHIDWKEKNLLLKAEFNVNVNNSDGVFDIQYGYVSRASHRNTSWDKAKFEVCGQKYADISDGGYGLAVLNDCKYGHSVSRGKLTLSLIKSSGYPNEYIDCDVHDFVYSVIPHVGNHLDAGIIEESILLNDPPVINENAVSGAKTMSLVKPSADGITLGAFKRAYDGDGYVMRVAENRNRRAKVTFEFGFAFTKAFVCSTLEEEQHEISVEDGKVTLDFKPFEIITIKLK